MRYASIVVVFICFPVLSVNCFKVMLILLSVSLLLFFTSFHGNIYFSTLAMLLSTLSCDCLYILYSCSHCYALNGLKSTYISLDLFFFHQHSHEDSKSFDDEYSDDICSIVTLILYF